MADVDIELVLQGGEIEDARRCYAPGSTVEGWTRLTPHGAIECRRVVARLEWQTAGRGASDQKCVDEIELWSGRLSGPLVREFALTVPQQPWSYTGHYINVWWRVLVLLDAVPVDLSDMLAAEPSRDELIVVAPRRAATMPPVPPRTHVPPDATPSR